MSGRKSRTSLDFLSTFVHLSDAPQKFSDVAMNGTAPAYDIVNFIYLSELIDLPVVRAGDGTRIGRLVDMVAAPGQVYPKITGILARVRGQREPLYIPWATVRKTAFRKQISVNGNGQGEARDARTSENEILLKKTFLDKQIISTSGYKLVRVNDLQLLIDNSSKECPNLWLVHVDIGVKGLLRRLGWLKILNAAFRWVVSRDMKDKFVSWKYVQPTSTANLSGSLHLKVLSSKLSEAHPADLADILEDLGTDERISLLESLDNATAAATFQEISSKVRLQMAESLDAAKLAAIVNEMQMDEAVDLLDELSPEKRSSVFAVLGGDKVSEIRELSKLSVYSVGSLMNTDFITARKSDTIGDVLAALKREILRTELIYYLYVIDDDERLVGVASLKYLLSAPPEMPVADIMVENVIAVHVDTNIKQVARIFFKYNFVAIPVVDEQNRMRGIISIRDALEYVFPEMKVESEG